MGKAESYTIEPEILSFRTADNCPFNGKGKGYTLIEVMIAVTLTLVLMYALAAIFGRVTSIMTQTQDILSMTNNLRAAKDRLREDLENLTVPHLKAPTSRYGFFSYSEGLGNAFTYLNFEHVPFYGFSLIRPQNSRTRTIYGNFNRRTASLDTTVGDTDDILSFTVRAPAGKWFRGRCFRDNLSPSDYLASIDDNIEIIESEYAEVIWFLRGTTLYRRVLLIVPDEFLEKRLQSVNRYIRYQIDNDNGNSEYSNLYENYLPDGTWNPLLPSSGYGFYRFFDISVHYDDDASLNWNDVNGVSYSSVSRVVANTLHDLANRKNRFGYWASPVIYPSDSSVAAPAPDSGLHGFYGGWYWMRMPTLQESTLWTGRPNSVFSFFCAGFPFGRAPFDFNLNDQSPQSPLSFWMGEYLRLGLGHNGPNPERSITFDNENLPDDFFIDQWQMPHPWFQQQQFSGQLDLSNIVAPTESKNLNTDVLLTNVLCFDVKVWNEKSSSFVDLGEESFYEPQNDAEAKYDLDIESDSSDFRSSGNYGLGRVEYATQFAPLYDPAIHSTLSIPYRPIMPAVFDTWTDEYQKDFLSQVWSLEDGTIAKNLNASSRPGFTVGDIPLDGNVTAADLPDYPPPYEAEIKVIQVELRTFDPVSRTIKNATVEIKIP